MTTDSNAAPDSTGYIMCTVERAGDLALWWRPDGQGYTTELDEAGLYSKEDAQAWTTRDLFVPEAVAKALGKTVVFAADAREAAQP